MGRCGVCGAPVSSGDAFCGSCGAASAGAAARSQPSMPPMPAPPVPPVPPVRSDRQVPLPAVVAAGAALVVVAVVALVVLGGSDPDDAEQAATTVPEREEPSRLEELTDTRLTDEEYVVDVLAVGEVAFSGATEAEHECDVRATVAAMGGAAALQDAGISPESLGAPFGLRGRTLPEGAVGRYLETARACGLDLTEVSLVRPLQQQDPSLGGCVSARIDRAYYDDVLAAYWLDPQRSTNALHLPNAAGVAYGELIRSCS